MPIISKYESTYYIIFHRDWYSHRKSWYQTWMRRSLYHNSDSWFSSYHRDALKKSWCLSAPSWKNGREKTLRICPCSSRSEWLYESEGWTTLSISRLKNCICDRIREEYAHTKSHIIWEKESSWVHIRKSYRRPFDKKRGRMMRTSTCAFF